MESDEDFALDGDDAAGHGEDESASFVKSEDFLPQIGKRIKSSPPLKRAASDCIPPQPFKRQKSLLNTAYLDILNRDIEDAAHRMTLGDDVDLPHSQLGLTFWTAVEKRQFFEALSRLGRYNIRGISAGIGTKSEIEVQHYISLLQEALDSRKKSAQRSYLEAAEYPAAVELSQQCCHAQEEAADAISTRQERREESREEKKWGRHWDITPSIASDLIGTLEEAETDVEGLPKFAQLFDVSNWLRLSERVFMNSSVPGNNWNFVDNKPPSIWATAFDDFYSLAVSITRRLVQSALFISMSRIRAKKVYRSAVTRDVVRKEDVKAAIKSLNMSPNGQDRWKTSARRLRLDVYQDPPDMDDDEGGEGGDDGDDDMADRDEKKSENQPMAYEEIEEKLAYGSDTDREQASGDDDGIWRLPALPSESDSEHDYQLEETSDADADSEAGEQQQSTRDEHQIDQEIKEVIQYSSADIRDMRSARQALRLRIVTERQQEHEADLHDEYASARAEIEMWDILRKKPPKEITKLQDPGRVHRSKLNTDSIFASGRDWASRLAFYAEWEALDAENEKVEEDMDMMS